MKAALLLLVGALPVAMCAYPRYFFAHCEKGGTDWAYIKEHNCVAWGASTGGACNGWCLNNNRRYCLFKTTENARGFKVWCEKDGYVAKAKNCGYGQAHEPVSCGADRVIPDNVNFYSQYEHVNYVEMVSAFRAMARQSSYAMTCAEYSVA
ncbi:hypothetical protein BGZ73_008455 [Actinomortierella ambigua]|nr:hypothetical protein BGZ73_008455 [Actinomortierella ambigua]